MDRGTKDVSNTDSCSPTAQSAIPLPTDQPLVSFPNHAIWMATIAATGPQLA